MLLVYKDTGQLRTGIIPPFLTQSIREAVRTRVCPPADLCKPAVTTWSHLCQRQGGEGGVQTAQRSPELQAAASDCRTYTALSGPGAHRLNAHGACPSPSFLPGAVTCTPE